MQPHALTLPCPHRRPALKEIKRCELWNVTSIEQVSGATYHVAELSAVFCIIPTDVRFGSKSGKVQTEQMFSGLRRKSRHKGVYEYTPKAGGVR